MPRPFFQATAEQVIIVAEAVASIGKCDAPAVAAFSDLPQATAESGLKAAVDLGLLEEKTSKFSEKSPLCRLLRTPQDKEKAAILRIALESYEPFLIFREELQASNNVTTAAQRTKSKLDLDCHREVVKETLLSFATYSGAMAASHGNSYDTDSRGLTALLDELVAGSQEVSDATETVHRELGAYAHVVSHELIIQPLVAGLRHAVGNNGREAVLQAGIATENFLVERATNHGTNIVGATGVNAKMDRLVQAGHYPSKLHNVCKYLGHIRNAADHGADTDIGAPWDISGNTGRNYVFVALSFLRAMLAHASGQHTL